MAVNYTTVNLLTDAEMSAVSVISLFTSGISCLGSLSVLACSVYYRRVFYPEVFPTFHLAVADLAASASLFISSSVFLDQDEAFPGVGGSCDYITSLVTSLYTVGFLLTVAYAMEALFRFRRKLNDSIYFDSSQARTMSSNWMHLVYAVAWLVPVALAVVLMVFTHQLRNLENSQVLLDVLPRQCSSCFANFRFNEDYCWLTIDYGLHWHTATRLLFLVPMMAVMGANLILHVLINHAFKQVAMRRGGIVDEFSHNASGYIAHKPIGLEIVIIGLCVSLVLLLNVWTIQPEEADGKLGLLSYHQRQEESTLNKKAALYQGVFFVCWLPSIILGIASFTDDYTMAQYYWLVVLQALLGPLQGIFNSVLYGWRRDSFRRALSERSSLLSTNRAAAAMSVTL